MVRVLNPTASPQRAELTLGFEFDRAETLRLDEESEDYPLSRDGQTLRFPVPPHALRTLGIV